MISISYNLSSALKNKLARIDVLYQEIMVAPVSLKHELQLRNNAAVAHIEGWASLANQPLSGQQIQDTVGQFHNHSSSPFAAKVISYKNSLNYVRENWTGNPAEVSFYHIKELSDILGVQYGSRQAIEPVLAYLQSDKIHPALQAALAHLSFYPSRLAYLLSQLFLARSGLDLRGWLSLENCWSSNKESYLKVLQETTASENSTAWLEYFCEALVVQMASIKTEVQRLYITPIQSVPKDINKRQKAILEMIQTNIEPVANRQIQAAFKISQITASRDLSKLSIYGLIASHGSGRSVSYTRI